jgi:methyl-accepting chemotaxis protein
MSAIANFKKRRAAEKAKQQNPSNQDAASTPAPENEALALLAYLLGCDESEAIAKAREAAEQKARFVVMNMDFSSGEDKSVIADVKLDDDGNITAISELSDSVNNATDSVNDAAESVNKAANDVSEVSSDLAYTADDIGQVTSELKEATAELKKPSAAPASSHSKKTAEPKNNSKK